MTNIEKEEIIKKAFFEELEKQAFIAPTLFKVLKGIGSVTKTFTKGKLYNYAEKGLELYNKGGKEALKDYMQAFKTPDYLKGGKGFVENNSKFLKDNAQFVKDNSGFMQSTLIDKKHMIEGLRNPIKSWGQELRNTRYTTKNINADNLLFKDGKAYLKGKFLGKDREILNLPKGYSDKDSVLKYFANTPDAKGIVKSNPLITAGKASFTNAGLLALPMATGGKDGVKEGLGTVALNHIPGGFEAQMAYDMLKKKKNPALQNPMQQT